MKLVTRSLMALAAAASLIAPATLNAELPQGARAPMFATQGALAGKPFAFNLSVVTTFGTLCGLD